MPAQAPPVEVGPPEIALVILACLIIFAIIGPKWWRARNAEKAG